MSAIALTLPHSTEARAHGVKIVVFDIGNVLIEWDPRHLYGKLFPGRPETMAWFLDHVCTSAWNLEQDGGRTWAAGVSALVAQVPEWRAEIEAYSKRWHEMIPRPIDGSVRLLAELKQAGVALYAITNFSVEKFTESLERFPFLSAFDGIVVSGQEGLLKPNVPIFALLCSRFGLAAAECIFIDDNADNVEGARAAGMTAILFTDPVALRVSLAQAGLPV